MTFKLHDAGRSESKRLKQQRDCTVRALATVLDINYDAAYERLKDAGRECNAGFDIEAWARKTTTGGFVREHTREGPNSLYPRQIYWRLHKMPWHKDHHEVGTTKRYRLLDFIKDNPKGRFMVSTARHVFAVCDGVAYDDAPWHYSENRPVYAWIEAKVVTLPLWQAYAHRKPISPGGSRMVKRAVAIVEAATYKWALRTAGEHYEWALKKGEDIDVTAIT